MQPQPDGYFSLMVPTAEAGTRYRFRLDRGETTLPDPASRYQPDGPHGPSEIVDVLTQKLVVRGREGLAAFILKGKAFPTVRPAHVSHQIFRLERLRGLDFAILAASGNVLVRRAG